MDAAEHQALTIEQFTRQAVPFAKLPGHTAALDLLVQLGSPLAADQALEAWEAAAAAKAAWSAAEAKFWAAWKEK